MLVVLLWTSTCPDALARAVDSADQGRIREGTAQLARIDTALRCWLAQARADHPFLVVDADREEVQLRHGGAVLRECSARNLRGIDGAAPMGLLGAHLRPYRARVPRQLPTPGPFTWEDVLVRAAPDDGALYFDSGLILYGDARWARFAAPTLQLSCQDLRALYEACPVGTPVVILPRNWRSGSSYAR